MRSLLLRLLFAGLRAMRPRTSRGSARTILLLQHQMPLGCVVHCTPLFAAIKKALPDATLIVATRGLAYATFRHDPHIDHLLETPDPRGSFVTMMRAASNVRRQVRELGLHPGLILQDATNRSGSFALLAATLRLGSTAGFANAAELYDSHLEYDPRLSLIDNNLRLVELLGAPTQHIEPAVYFTADELADAATLLDECRRDGRPVAAIVVQGSGGQRTTWHEDRFAAVIRHMEDRGWGTVFLGTAVDAEQIDGLIARTVSLGSSLAGRTSIPQLAALLTQCDLLVSVDTGTMHVGRAAGLPMVVLGPSWQRPVEWLPLQLENVRILRGPDRDDVPPNYRLDEIETSAVIEAIDELSSRYPASAADRDLRAERLLSTTRL